MRATTALLALLLLLLPGAAALDPRSGLSVSLEGFGGPVMPLAGHGVANGTVQALCVPTSDGRPHRVALQALDVPSWARVVVSPAEVAVPADCEGAWSTEVRLAATLDAQAPAYRPATLRLRAASEGDSLGPPVEATVELVPDYFGILEVQVLEPIRKVKPGETAVFPLRVTNAGNGRVEVRVSVVEAPEGLVPREPAPFILGSAQQGANETTAIVPVSVETRGGGGLYVNEVGSVTFALTERPLDGGAAGAERTVVSVIVTRQGFATPAPGAAPLLAAFCGVALALAARRARR